MREQGRCSRWSSMGVHDQQYTHQTVAKAYLAACTPDIYLFDKDLSCVYRGRLDASTPKNNEPLTGEDLRCALDALLAGQPVSEQQTPSVGCNIKWK